MKLFTSRSVFLLIICLNLIGVAPLVVTAQTSNRHSSRQKKKELVVSPLQQRGLETLDSLSLEARQVDNPAIRADLQALIGDAIWDFDKPNARKIFTDAFKNARGLEDADDARTVQTEILKHVWKRDRSLAEELLKQLSVGKAQRSAEDSAAAGLSNQFGMQSSDPTAQQKLDLAKTLMEDDSTGAANLIQESLQREVNFAVINQLTQLKARDPGTANQIFARAVGQLQSLPSSAGLTAAIAMADYVSSTCSLCAPKPGNPALLEAYYPTALSILRRSLGEVPAPQPIKRELQEKVVQYFHETQAMLALTLSRFAGPADLSELQTIYRERIQTLAPIKQRLMQTFEQQQKAPDRLEEMFRRADSIAEPDQHDIALANIAQLALRQDPDEKVLERLEEKIRLIETKALHDKVWSLLKARQVEKYLKVGDLDQAYGWSLKLTDPLVRGNALRLVASAVAKRGSDHLISSDLLNEAFESFKKGDASIERTQAMFKIASDFVNLKDYDHSFDALGFSSESLGQLKKNDFEHTNKEAVPNSLFQYEGTFGRLGKVDFDRALFVAQTIRWREFRLAAQIATCRSVLSRGK